MGAGERAAGGADRTSILGSAFEAFIGAVYLASGLDAVAGMIEREHLLVVERPEMADPDAKTELQERIQAQRLATPHYEEDASGPPHSRTFTSRVYVGDRCIGEGTGPSKKLAQQAAATAALAAAALATAEAAAQAPTAHAESTAAVTGPHGESNAQHDAGGPESLVAPRRGRGGRGARGAAPFNPSAP